MNHKKEIPMEMNEYRELLEKEAGLLIKDREIVEVGTLREGSACFILVISPDIGIGQTSIAPCTIGKHREDKCRIDFESQSNWVESNVPVIVRKQSVTS